MSAVTDAQDYLVKQGFTRAQAEYLTRPDTPTSKTKRCIVCGVDFTYPIKRGRAPITCSHKCAETRSRRGVERVPKAWAIPRNAHRKRMPVE